MRLRNMRHFLGLVVLLIWVISALSQPSPLGFPVTGIIQDPTKAGIPGAKTIQNVKIDQNPSNCTLRFDWGQIPSATSRVHCSVLFSTA